MSAYFLVFCLIQSKTKRFKATQFSQNQNHVSSLLPKAMEIDTFHYYELLSITCHLHQQGGAQQHRKLIWNYNVIPLFVCSRRLVSTVELFLSITCHLRRRGGAQQHRKLHGAWFAQPSSVSPFLAQHSLDLHTNTATYWNCWWLIFSFERNYGE